MCRKYRCLPSELSTTIRRGKASTTISDDFNRADGATIGNQLTWTETAGTWRTSTNRAEIYAIGAFALARAESDLSDDDHNAQAVLTASSICYGGACIRFSSAANTCYVWMACIGDTIGNSGIHKYVDGSRTQLQSTKTATVSGRTQKTDISGTTIKGFEDASELISVTDSSISGNYRVGLASFSFSYSVYFTVFSATDGIVPGNPYYAYAQQQ